MEAVLSNKAGAREREVYDRILRYDIETKYDHAGDSKDGDRFERELWKISLKVMTSAIINY